jgi:hypothetical protein
MSDRVLSYILLVGILIRCISYIPLIHEVQKYEYTQNIPYATLFMELLSYVIFIIIASMKQFYIQVICLLFFIILVVYMVYLKIKYDKYARPLNVRR